MEGSCRSGKLYKYNGSVTITASNVSSFVTSQAETVKDSLNSWITANSASYSMEFAPWVVKDGKPTLNLGELENK